MSNCGIALLCLLTALSLGYPERSKAHGAGEPIEVEFLISSARGGGWDKTARGVGHTLEKTGLGKVTDFLNLTSTYGSRAVRLISGDSGQWSNTLLVQSAPLILRPLVSKGQPSWRGVKPVAVMISAFQVVAVPYDSPYRDIHGLLDDIRRRPFGVPVTGSAGYFSLDHLTLAMVLNARNVNPHNVRYVPADGGGDALNRLLAGHAKAIVGGFGELIEAHENRKIRILGVTSQTPLPRSNIPTFRAQGIDVVFKNWRGFFAAPGISAHKLEHYETMLVDMAKTPEWIMVRERHGWEDLVLTGQDMDRFLVQQEAALSRVLEQFGLPREGVFPAN